MKPQHRHELKTNELAEWLANFPQWAKKNRTTIIYVSILIIAVAAAYFWRRYQKNVVSVQKQLELTRLVNQLPQSRMRILQAQAQGRDFSLMLLQPADDLQIFAQNTKNAQMAALAFIKRAEALRMELHYRLESAPKQEAIDQINRAKASYAKALEKAPSNVSLMATAKFGLGLCEEELGNFEKAKQTYRDITTTTEFEGTVAATQAMQRLNTMSDYQQKVVFKPPPKPSPAEPIQPQFQLNPPDVNIVPEPPSNALGKGASLQGVPNAAPNTPLSQ